MVDVRIIGTDCFNRTQFEQSMTKKDGLSSGMLVYTERRLDFNSSVIPFLNAVNGNQLAVNSGFTGNPAFIYVSGGGSASVTGTTDGAGTNELHDSGGGLDSASVGMVVEDSTGNFAKVVTVNSAILLTLDANIMGNPEAYTIGEEWAGTAVQGSWNFTTDISLTSGSNNDEAQFDSKSTHEMTNYVAVTGKITLTTWNPANNDMAMSFSLAGILQGNSVNLNEYVDTAITTQQSFAIPIGDLGIGADTVDEMNLILSRAGGPAAAVDLDDIQFEKAGGAVVYNVTIPRGEIFHVQEIRYSLTDALSVTLASATMPNLSYNKILDLSKLANGIVFQRTQDNKTLFSINLRQLADFTGSGADIVNAFSDNTNTYMNLVVKFPENIVLKGDTGDTFRLIVNDNLSDLVDFTVVVRGSFEA